MVFMKSWSLVTRWVFYQASITIIIITTAFFSVETLVHLGVGAGIKASVQILKPEIIELNNKDLEAYFLKIQPAFVGLYKPNGDFVYRPENDLPVNVSDIESSTKLYEKRYLLYVERLKNDYYLLGFTSQERMYYIEEYITKTITVVLCIVFILSSIVAYLILKKLYRPVEKLSLQMNSAIHTMEPLYLEAKELEDPKIRTLIEVYNQLIETIEDQFSRLQKKQKQQRLILETLEEGICLVSPDQSNNYVNSQGYHYLKAEKEGNAQNLFSNSELGEKIKDLLKPSVKKPLKEKIHDKFRYYEVTLKNILENQQLIVILDETDRIEKLEAGKNFISNASHELRTPITIIKGFAEALSDKEALEHIKIDEVMPKILSACDRMDALIKRLLLLADVDQKTIELNKFDMASTLRQEVALFQNLDPKASITYEGPQKTFFIGDEDLLKIVFSNLLSNSLKYSQEPKKIIVSLKVLDNSLEISFKDNGIGIPQTDLKKVFDRFYRVDKARTRKMGGAGLGLSLVKTIIDKHQGYIGVESIIHEGSTFIIRLPNPQ
jgi:signal transduction histidine kinase